MPAADVAVARLVGEGECARDPLLGEVRYFSVVAGAEPVAMRCDSAEPPLAAIRGYFAFHPGRVDAFRVLPDSHQRMP